MTCLNCNTINNGESKFCIKCGEKLLSEPIQTQANPIQQEFSTVEPIQQPTNENIQTNQVIEKDTTKPNYLKLIVNVLLKPITTIKNSNNFDTKGSIIFTAIITLGITLLNVIKTILTSIIVRSYDWSAGKESISFTLDNLKDIPWIQLIFRNFAIYLVVIAAIALVYFIASSIIKKQADFNRLLTIATFSVIPFALASLVVAPLLAIVYLPLKIVVMIIGGIYSALILVDSMSEELTLKEDDNKIYINAACLSVLGIMIYYIFIKFFVVTTINGLDKILDIFN